MFYVVRNEFFFCNAISNCETFSKNENSQITLTVSVTGRVGACNFTHNGKFVFGLNYKVSITIRELFNLVVFILKVNFFIHFFFG